MATKPIFVTLGKKRFAGGTLTERYGANIATDPITMALGPSRLTPPETGWVAPTFDMSTAPNKRTVKLLVDAAAAAAFTLPCAVYCWGNISDNPEVEPIMMQGPLFLV